MLSIFDLLCKIKWSGKDKPTDYTLFYYDRIAQTEKELPLPAVQHFDRVFLTTTLNGKETMIPLHRIRKIYKGTMCVWKRPSRPH